jgi:hypothetical protein
MDSPKRLLVQQRTRHPICAIDLGQALKRAATPEGTACSARPPLLLGQCLFQRRSSTIITASGRIRVDADRWRHLQQSRIVKCTRFTPSTRTSAPAPSTVARWFTATSGVEAEVRDEGRCGPAGQHRPHPKSTPRSSLIPLVDSSRTPIIRMHMRPSHFDSWSAPVPHVPGSRTRRRRFHELPVMALASL